MIVCLNKDGIKEKDQNVLIVTISLLQTILLIYITY